ncbi:amino acid permease C-terminal domain-containing protein [Nocardia mangyaensis]
MLELSVKTWLRFAIWMALGVIVYFTYGRGHSVLRRERPPVAESGPTPAR